MSSEFDSISTPAPEVPTQDTADEIHIGALPATEPAKFDADEAVKAAEARLTQIDAETEVEKGRKAAAQVKINKLAEERKTVARFVSASKPRTRKSSK